MSLAVTAVMMVNAAVTILLHNMEIDDERECGHDFAKNYNKLKPLFG